MSTIRALLRSFLGLGAGVACLLSSALLEREAAARERTIPGRFELRRIERSFLSAAPVRRRPALTNPRAQSLADALTTRTRSLREKRNRLSGSQRSALGELRSRTRSDAQVRVRPAAGTPRRIKGRRLRSAWSRLAGVGDAGLEAARAFLRENRELLCLDDPDEELSLVGSSTDELGRRRLRFAQFYKELEVWPAELDVHLDAAGNVDLMNGAFVPTPRNAIIVPLVGEDEALARARDEVPGGAPAKGPDLVLFTRGNATARLAWRMELDAPGLVDWSVVIDASDGGVLRAQELVMTGGASGSGTDVQGVTRSMDVWEDSGTYYLCDTSKSMFDPTSSPPSFNSTHGGLVVGDLRGADPMSTSWSGVFYNIASSSPGSWSLADGVSASWSLSRIHDYWLTRHGLDSADGQGMSMLLLVRGGGASEHNALSGGFFLVFGDGEDFVGELDIVGHEYAHSVVRYSANLEYQGQSGAMNEGYADIFGESSQTWISGVSDWEIGPSLSAPRSLANPGAYNIGGGYGPYPSKMSQFINTTLDYGGVHMNCTIPGHAFYLLAEGMTGAIGRQDAERIFYRALTRHLNRLSQFIDLRHACVDSAEELFGAGSTQAQRTTEAFALIELGDAPPTEEPEEFPEINAADSALFIAYDSDDDEYYLARRETAFGDDATVGVWLDRSTPLTPQRLAVSGDGSMGIFVAANNDAGLVDTDTGEIAMLGVPGEVHSVAMAPDGEHFAFVFLDGLGDPTNSISVIDIGTETGDSYELEAPINDGATVNTVLYADAMDFSADNRLLLYDALNQITESGGGSHDVWSMYALDLVTGETIVLMDPRQDLDVGNPAFAQTSDNFIVFEAYDLDTDTSTIYAANLSTGDASIVGSVTGGFGVPVYTGDDGAVVFTVPDGTVATEYSLQTQGVTGRMTPSGSLQRWLTDGFFASVYRRGTFTTPNAEPDAQINSPVTDASITEGDTVLFTATGMDPNGHYPLAYRWDFDGGAPTALVEDPGNVPFDNPGVYQVRLTVTDSEGLADSTPHRRTVTVSEAPPPPSDTGGGGCVYAPGAGFDPSLLLLLGAGLALKRRRRRRGVRE